MAYEMVMGEGPGREREERGQGTRNDEPGSEGRRDRGREGLTMVRVECPRGV